MTQFALPIVSFDGLASLVFEHFGRTEYFAVIDVDTADIHSVSLIQNQQSYGSVDKNLVDLLADHGIDVVLAGQMGPCLTTPLLDRGIRVFTGAEGTLQDALKMYRAGKLKEVQKSRYSF